MLRPENIWGKLKNFEQMGGLNFPHINPRGRIWHVDTADGSDSNPGLYGGSGSELANGNAFLTMSKALSMLDHYDNIVFDGVVKEQLVSPQDVFDITIIGGANRPRQATDGGVHTGGGSSWLAPDSPAATTPLLKIVEQGWKLVNIMFSPVASSACVRLSRAEIATDMDGSHAIFIGCYFVGGGASGIGIEDVGGCSRALIDSCRFEGLGGHAIKGISTGIAVPTHWRITRNIFNGNTNAIGISVNESLVDGNFIRQTANDANNKVNLVAVAAQGSLNQVIDNIFPDAAANVTIAKGYKPGTTDVWRNFVTDTAAYIVTVPA